MTFTRGGGDASASRTAVSAPSGVSGARGSAICAAATATAPTGGLSRVAHSGPAAGAPVRIAPLPNPTRSTLLPKSLRAGKIDNRVAVRASGWRKGAPLRRAAAFERRRAERRCDAVPGTLESAAGLGSPQKWHPSNQRIMVRRRGGEMVRWAAAGADRGALQGRELSAAHRALPHGERPENSLGRATCSPMQLRDGRQRLSYQCKLVTV